MTDKDFKENKVFFMFCVLVVSLEDKDFKENKVTIFLVTIYNNQHSIMNLRPNYP